MKMVPVSHKPIKTTQFFQDNGHSPRMCRSGCNWWSGVTWKSPEVKWRHNPVFANRSRQDGDRDAQMVPNDSARRAASEDMHIDLLESWSDVDLTLTWLEVKFPNLPFKVNDYMLRSGLARRLRWHHFHFRFTYIKKVINEKPSPKTKKEKTQMKQFFIWWPLEQLLSQYFVQEGANLARVQCTRYQNPKTPWIWPTIFWGWGQFGFLFSYFYYKILFYFSAQGGGERAWPTCPPPSYVPALEPKPLTLGQIWSENVVGAWGKLPNAFFRILPSYHTFGDDNDCLRKITIF